MAVVVGGLVGRVLGAELARAAYRLDDETGPGPRLPPAAVTVGLAALWGLLAWRFGPSASYALAPAYLGFAVVGVVLTWVDADVHRLPRGITRPAYPMLVAQLALASLASGDWGALLRAVVAGVVLWLVYLLVAVVAALLGKGFGFGDVTLAGLVGLATGYVSLGAPSSRRMPPSSSRGRTASRGSSGGGGHARRDRLRAVDAARRPRLLVVEVRLLG